jgi:methyl-accepting chemotaxis protein
MRLSPKSLLLVYLGFAVLATLANTLGYVLDWATLGLSFALLFGTGASALVLQMAEREKTLLASVQYLIDGQQHRGTEVAPAWGRHIASSKAQMESAIGTISQRFSGVVDKLRQTAHTASLETDMLTVSGKPLMTVIARAEEELEHILQAQQSASSSMVNLLEKVEGLDRFTKELQYMAHEVAKIAQQATLLSLNPTREAAQAGELGRGFAVVEKEFRTLSNQSGEMGRHIAEKVQVISAAIEESSSNVRDSVRQRDERNQIDNQVIASYFNAQVHYNSIST